MLADPEGMIQGRERKFDAAKMVIKTLEKIHKTNVEFKFQGSIETNTHIWSENDIDIVTSIFTLYCFIF